MSELILASTSPRRRLLLELAGIPHEVDAEPVDESVLEGEPPIEYATRLARAKALAVAARHPDQQVLGADTVVILDDSILGKPANSQDAESMLHRLAGRRHEVLTAVAVVCGDVINEEVERTVVWMSGRDPSLIRAYVASGEPMDKAGAYAAQGLGALLIDHIDGDFFNVMGLPLCRVVEMLES
jgi:septum formation protein